jgi:HEAT repeat protein
MNEAEIAALVVRFSSLDETTCEAEAIALGQQGEKGLRTLTTLLTAAEADARFWAVRGLWANGSTAAVTMLSQVLRDPEEMVRSGAALALGEMKAETTTDSLAELLTGDPSASGDHAADALAKIGHPAVQVLIEVMAHEQPWVRRRAAKALIPVESKEAIPALFRALEDESYMVRYYAEEALVRMGVGPMVYFRM